MARNDANFKLYIVAAYKGTLIYKDKEYFFFEIPNVGSEIWIRRNYYNNKIIADSDPEINDEFKIAVEAVPYNGTAFLGYKLFGRC